MDFYNGQNTFCKDFYVGQNIFCMDRAHYFDVIKAIDVRFGCTINRINSIEVQLKTII